MAAAEAVVREVLTAYGRDRSLPHLEAGIATYQLHLPGPSHLPQDVRQLLSEVSGLYASRTAFEAQSVLTKRYERYAAYQNNFLSTFNRSSMLTWFNLVRGGLFPRIDCRLQDRPVRLKLVVNRRGGSGGGGGGGAAADISAASRQQKLAKAEEVVMSAPISSPTAGAGGTAAGGATESSEPSQQQQQAAATAPRQGEGGGGSSSSSAERTEPTNTEATMAEQALKQPAAASRKAAAAASAEAPIDYVEITYSAVHTARLHWFNLPGRLLAGGDVVTLPPVTTTLRLTTARGLVRDHIDSFQGLWSAPGLLRIVASVPLPFLGALLDI